MRIYLEKDRQNAAQTVTATHATGRSLTRKIEGVGLKLYIGSLFSSPYLFDNMHRRGINCCGTVKQNHKGMLGELSQ
jgi:hypothetical protein